MYVCICNGHRASEIRSAAEAGLRNPREIYAHLGKPPRCGCCLEYAAKLIEDVHASLGKAVERSAEPACEPV
jgi:bacterioferritin-associated ferredoxin